MMNVSIAQFYAIIGTFIWIGFVGAISFMESWVKFKAPNVNLSIGLGIGRLVFKALNYVEWFFALTIILGFLWSGISVFSSENLPLLVALFIIMLQSFWMLPVLDRRASKVIAGENLQKSYLHFYYVGGEMIKLACLIYFGIMLLQF